KLAERGLEVSPDTLRRWLLAEGLWQRKRRRDQHRSRRPRRSCYDNLLEAAHFWLFYGNFGLPGLLARIAVHKREASESGPSVFWRPWRRCLWQGRFCVAGTVGPAGSGS
ncbi:MAG: hypothetical protein ACYC3I_16810, partial [Gemmataceae bacterium]